MGISHVRPQPPLLFGLVIFAALVLLLGRGVLPRQDSPAFPLSEPAGIRILFGSGFPNPGVHQFSDGITLQGVIDLTGLAATLPEVAESAGKDNELADGVALAISNSTGKAAEIEQGWMSARQRLALGIPLHPDRMSREDWVSLPGIGEKMAAQIEQDRQNYGDFGGFEALDRVKGIGPAKLKALRPFFSEGDKRSE
jgi:competence protein ComEA